ncbi:glycoside hydrolase superfamily [Biscogniauxia mediterranea]|nr:glycoside hydrolase superfamily [Biscogniauxia mediterranea]
MRSRRFWAFAQLPFVGLVSGAEESVNCALATTTIFVPTTVYVAALLADTTNTAGQGESFCSVPTSAGSEEASTSKSLGATSGVEAPTSIPTSSIFSTSSWSNISVGTTSVIRTSREPPRPTGITPPPPPPSPPTPFRGFKNAVYFTSWGTSRYQPQELPVSELTHILYAFADIAPNGTVLPSDPAVDLEKRYPPDVRERDRGQRNAYGVVKQLFVHKKRHRHLKTLLSVGGWEYSPKFAAVAASEAGRQAFARSAARLVTDWGFDGIDVDWEYPASEAEGRDFVELLAACRRAFDRYASRHRLAYRFLISVASPATAQNYRFMDLPRMDKYVDEWHLMAYDYSGSWDTTSGHQANVFRNGANALSTKHSTDDAVTFYESQGVSSRKIVVGLPVYGRSFEGTSGLGQNYSSVGAGGPQPGVWLYEDLPRAGAREQWDDVAKAAYSYDPEARELISYDNVRSTAFKARYLEDRQLGGAFFWEASGDKAGAGSLVSTMSKNLRRLDRTPNNLHYPTSQYANIRFGLPGV